MLCGVGFLSAIVVSFLDIYGVKQLGQDTNLKMNSKNVVSKLAVVDAQILLMQGRFLMKLSGLCLLHR